MDKFSVILAAYNTEELLEECILSVLHQTRPVDEFIIIDDGSTDRSPELIDKYAAEYPNIIVFHQRNAGQAAARNVGLAHASGNYIGFIDSDDWYDPNFIEELYNCCQKNGASIACASMSDYYSKQNVVRHDYAANTDPFKITPSVCNKLFRRNLIGDLRFQEGRWYEDFGFFHALLSRNPVIAYTTSTTYNCHCRPVSTMFNDNALQNLDILFICNYIESLYPKPLPTAIREKYEYIYLDTLLISTINRLAIMHNRAKNNVIATIRLYVKNKFPDWATSQTFRNLPFKRRIIAYLNGHGLHKISRLIIGFNGVIKQLRSPKLFKAEK